MVNCRTAWIFSVFVKTVSSVNPHSVEASILMEN